MREAIIRVKKQLRDAFMNANKQCLQAVTERPSIYKSLHSSDFGQMKPRLMQMCKKKTLLN